MGSLFSRRLPRIRMAVSSLIFVAMISPTTCAMILQLIRSFMLVLGRSVFRTVICSDHLANVTTCCGMEPMDLMRTAKLSVDLGNQQRRWQSMCLLVAQLVSQCKIQQESAWKDHSMSVLMLYALVDVLTVLTIHALATNNPSV